MTSKPRILYIPTENCVHDEEAWKEFNNKFEVITYDEPSEESFIKEIEKKNGKYTNIDGICRSTWLKGLPYKTHYLFRGEPVKKLPSSVKIIVQSGHGYDIVDLKYLTSRGIVFCNSPNTCTRATADVGIYLILSSFRYLTFAENCVRTLNYTNANKLASIATNPENHVLGIIGLGDIGFQVAKAAKAFGMKIVYYSRNRKINLENEIDATYCSTLDKLWEVTDCIFIACPHTPETHHLINDQSFKKMKSNVRIVNIARGPIIDENSLVSAIDRGQVVGIGLDVFEFEPKINEKIRNNYMTTILPHIGVCTTDSFKAFERTCVNNLIEYFYGSGIPPTAINPQVLGK